MSGLGHRLAGSRGPRTPGHHVRRSALPQQATRLLEHGYGPKTPAQAQAQYRLLDGGFWPLCLMLFSW